MSLDLDYRPTDLVTNLVPRFFIGPDGRNMVEIMNNAGTAKNTLIQYVDDSHIRRFPRQWAGFQVGREKIDHGGTPLTEVPGIDMAMATSYQLRGVHNVETLAELPDASVEALGIGAITARNAARLVLRSQRATALEKLLEERTAPPAPGKKAA